MAKQRTHSIEFKRQVVQDYLGGETLYGLAKRHEISRTLIRVWLAKHEAGVLDSDTAAADMLADYEARIAALERLEGKRPDRAATPAVRCNDRQRPRRADLPEPCREHRADKPEPALGCRHQLHRYRDQLRLSRCDPRRLVTASCRLCDRQGDRRTFSACRIA